MNEISPNAGMSPVEQRPKAFPMAIQGGMLEALGINMYTTIGKCLVEFVANAYDSDATSVNVTIPYARISDSRRAVRESARELAEKNKEDPFKTVLLAPLPDDLVIEVKDDGHGMSPQDVRDKFMPINRKRRLDQKGNETENSSESGRRFVMGRKGLGKLAGFGAAEQVAITTKRKGETFSTTFVMDFNVLKNSENLANVEIPATYQEGLPGDTQGTTVSLRRLKCDAVSHSHKTIAETVASAFYGIRPEDFQINVNGEALEPITSAYEFAYAPEAGADGFSRTSFAVEDIGSLEFDYIVQFRARIPDPSNPDLATGPLAANKRGARIYCNNRLAAGPSLLDLKTGMHNFYATDYMECIVRADSIDRHAIDFVNTNRTQLREDNEVVQKLIAAVTEVMRVAVYAHGQWREGVVNQQIDSKVNGSRQLRWISQLPKKQQTAAKNVLKALAVTHDLESEEFGEIAPHFMDAMNSSDILVKLISLRTDPESIAKIARYLNEWDDVERRDVLKHYKARRNAITALASLIEQGETVAAGDRRTEKQLHNLLKVHPWMVRPEYSNFVSSDSRMTTTLSKVAQVLAVDEFSAPHVDEEVEDGKVPDETRPDLVFVLGNQPEQPYHLTVVELKSPTIPLNFDHYRQLSNYVRQVEEWVERELQRKIVVNGMLVGKMPKRDTKSQNQKELFWEIDKHSSASQIEVIGLQDMLERTRVVHMQIIDVLEAQEENDGASSVAADGASLREPGLFPVK